MRVATFNCNSVRQRLSAILAWLDGQKPDVLGLQETKVQDADFPLDAFTDAGWSVSFRGQKSYNGVALIACRAPDEVSFGLGDDDGESEPRLVRARFGDLQVINTYVPQGRALDSPNFAFKLEWFARFRLWCDRNLGGPETPAIWMGDLNVAPTPADVYDPKSIAPHVCFCPEVIAAFEETLSWGFVDVFRKHLPAPETFTFWDYRQRHALERNRGWRIDHMLATPEVAALSTGCQVDLAPRRAPKPSDHTFVWADFDRPL